MVSAAAARRRSAASSLPREPWPGRDRRVASSGSPRGGPVHGRRGGRRGRRSAASLGDLTRVDFPILDQVPPLAYQALYIMLSLSSEMFEVIPDYRPFLKSVHAYFTVFSTQKYVAVAY